MKGLIRKSESGQAVVLLVFAMIALLGFAALAVDGSMLYSDRRFAQSGADASSLAGGAQAALAMDNAGIAWWNWPATCTGDPGITTIPTALNSTAEAAKTAAVFRANSNSFAIDDIQNVDGYNDVVVYCGSVPIGSRIDKFMDIRTRITMNTETAFVHVVYSGISEQRVEAVTRVRPRQPFAYGYAIVALNPDGCSGINTGAGFTGNSEVNVHKGGVFSNGCMRANNNADVNVYGAGIGYRYLKGDLDSFNFYEEDGVTGSATQISDADRIPSDAYVLDPPPNCNAARYQGSWPPTGMQSGNIVNLLPGLYCISGGIKLTSKDGVYGNGVTIYLTSGDFDMHAKAEANISAPDPTDGNPPVYGALEGLLIYAPNTGNVTINGNSNSYYQGLILAPQAWIKMNGGSNVDAFRTQIVGWDVQVAGGNGSNVWYDAEKMASYPGYIDLWR